MAYDDIHAQIMDLKPGQELVLEFENTKLLQSVRFSIANSMKKYAEHVSPEFASMLHARKEGNKIIVKLLEPGTPTPGVKAVLTEKEEEE